MINKWLVIMILLSSLSACAWHLRGNVALPEAMHRIAIVPESSYTKLRYELRSTLALSAAQVVPLNHTPSLILHIIKEVFNQQPISISTQGVTQENRLSYQLTFSVSDSQGKERLPERTISIERRAYYDPNDLLSSKEEVRTINAEMRHDAINQLIRQLVAHTQTWQQRAASNEIAH